MTHDPSVREVMEATRYLLERRKRSCDNLIRWTGRDRETVHVLATYVALTTNQSVSSLRAQAEPKPYPRDPVHESMEHIRW